MENESRRSSSRTAASPWPRVRTGGKLEPALREWVHSNGAGAYSMSTLALMHTRRQHGLLVAALEPPVGRHVVLSHAEAILEVHGRRHRLATHRFPDMAPTPGYRLLEAFAQDPIPRWTYRIGRASFERTVCLGRGRNAVVLGFTWNGGAPIALTVRPLLALRPVDALSRERAAMAQTVGMKAGAVQVRPIPDLPPVFFAHEGVFVGSPDWWRRFEYAVDQDTGRDCQEDLWTPGRFEIRLHPGETARIVCAVGSLPGASAEELEEEAADQIRWFDPGPTRPIEVRWLSVAAAPYCADRCERPAVVAGFPSSGVHIRDLLISLPGLYLVRGQVHEARRVLGTVVDQLEGGCLPRLLPEGGGRDAPCGDSTLWLFEAGAQLIDVVGDGDEFVRSRLYPAMRQVFEAVRRGDPGPLRLSPEGFVAVGPEDHPQTWMDSRRGDRLVEERRGLPVELQALWSKGCAVLARLAAEQHDTEISASAATARDAVLTGFGPRFWCNETQYPFDVVSSASGTGDTWADPAVRPNALIALAVDPFLFTTAQSQAVLQRVRSDLLTPWGVRALRLGDPSRGGGREVGGRRADEDVHHGAAWPFLLGAYVRAAVRLHPDDARLRAALRRAVERIVAAGEWSVVGQVGQVVDPDAPQRPLGCPAQAWSVAELLRALVLDLGL